mgnify:CR=1 FL=1
MSRINMYSTSTATAPYVKFDGHVNYKPTKWTFSIYMTETKESHEVTEIRWALITKRNVALASSFDDKPVSSQDFDSFDEKLYMRESVKAWKVVSKDLTYMETKEVAHKLFPANSFRLGTSIYLVTEKWAVLKLVLVWTTRQKVNEQLEALSNIDFVTLTPSKESITVWAGSRSQEVFELTVTEETKEYTRVAIDKINWTVNKLKEILEFKKTGKKSEPEDEDDSVTESEAEEVFTKPSKEEDSSLPI